MQRFRIATNEDKPVPEGVIPREIDREDYIKLMIAYGIEPYYSEGDERVIWVCFDPTDVQKFENIYLNNKAPIFTVQMIDYSNSWWRNLIVSWKSKKKYLEEMERQRVR